LDIPGQYQPEGRRYDEGQLFDQLQQDLPDTGAPGCVHVVSHGVVKGILTSNVATRRQEKRLVMTTVGESLYHCKSVFDFLEAMYDALEGVTPFISVHCSSFYEHLLAHRWILVARGILHRDIGINNILLSNIKLPQSRVPDINPQLKFIKFSIRSVYPPYHSISPSLSNALKYSSVRAPSTALFCDLDNGCHSKPQSSTVGDHKY
jgi:hypothetical protein